ncbi:MAG: hypothetical protein ACP5N2_05975 [Candidatus Nanoarchaeia archaeon]
MVAPPGFNPITLMVSELIFTTLVVFLCFLIYFKTRESYQLTKYKGLGYFRQAFVFLGFSYIVRFIFSAMMLSGIVFNTGILGRGLLPLFIIPLGYFSTIAIFYLLYSLIWKRIEKNWLLIVGHLSAIILTVVAFITRSPMMLLYLQSLLLVIAGITALLLHRGKNKRSSKNINMKILYFLVSVLWLFNLWVIDIRAHFPFEIKIVCQLISILVFCLIYVRLYKWVK